MSNTTCGLSLFTFTAFVTIHNDVLAMHSDMWIFSSLGMFKTILHRCTIGKKKRERDAKN